MKKKRVAKPVNKRQLLKWLGVGLILTTITATAMVMSENRAKLEYDLSVIGNGTATMVQVHDPKCQLCQRLQRVVGNTKGEFEDSVQFRTAKITTDTGRQFAAKYGVPHVTLLMFNKRGKHVNTLRGVSSKEQVREALQELTQ